jgi:molybdate transport system regulatory protein
MKIKIKVSIFKDPSSPIMGPGPLRLLEKIQEFKSINQAAKSMNLSYVKALNMLNRLEENLEHKILIRRRGGNERGGAELTPFAEAYIKHYRSLEQKISRFAERKFQSFLEKTE